MTTIPFPTATKRMHFCTMAVGPDVAARWLEGNTHNRPIYQSRVDQYAAEMKAGRWNLTHQGIAFDVNGVLRDGQHRLWAIVESGCTIETQVTFNLATDVIESIDDIKARSVCDRMNISGRFSDGRISTNQLSVLRAMLRGLKPNRRIAYHDECRLLAEHLPAIRFALEHLATTRIKGVSAPNVCAVVARAWYSQDTTVLARFCEVLRTGIAAPDEAVVILLRDYLGSRDCSNKLANLREQYGKAERALLAYVKGQSLTILRPSQSEVFPLPGEESESR